MNSIFTAKLVRQISQSPCQDILKNILKVALQGGTTYDYGRYSYQRIPDYQIEQLRNLGYIVDVKTEISCDKDSNGKDILGSDHKIYSYKIFW